MMLSRDPYEGAPPRLYRGCEEIRSDISELRAELREIEERLTVRNVLMELVSSTDHSDPALWVPVLEDIAAEAREALDRLNSFGERIEELREELLETRCALGY
ncbi:MAG: hypothetical protein IKJ13_01825 [Clostridia bacterium]|nr:hypothetical protein [Clostridia bacterium]MBR3805561.1 hypothetical protein [Clostridia bacterium]